ncbi:MAG: hypothetical protein UY07_C0006G0007 [Parcubacteria group bacterium GW2011_GWA1_47_8]|nr:MAG: hypothetical protein UY07_C0006G0007 [Parcubacteria group bacterium GW2011_GWA1_47_8]
MLSISQFLSRFKNVSNTEKAKKGLIVGVFRLHNIPVIIPQVVLQKNTIFLKVPPIIKTEILIKKEEILRKIRNLPGCDFFSDIY